MEKIKKGDEVIVIAGRSKGQRGSVLKRIDADRLLVENVNMVKKHVKGNPRSGDAGGIIEQREGHHDRRQRLLYTTQRGHALAVDLTRLQQKRLERARKPGQSFF